MNQRYGNGIDRIAQSVASVMEEIKKTSTRVLRATCISGNAIRVDEDGYDSHFDEELFVNLSGISYKAGDRLAVVPMVDERGKLLVIGKISPYEVADRDFVDIIEMVGEDQIVANEDAGFQTRSVVFSNKMFYNGSKITIYGDFGGSGSITFSDGENGMLGINNNPGDFEIAVDPEKIGSNVKNRLSFVLANASPEVSATVSKVFVAIERP